MKENAFLPDRSQRCDGVRHIPEPGQGSSLIYSGGTPTDAEVAPVLCNYTNEMQPIEYKDAAPPNLGASYDLMQQGINHDWLGTIPRISDFPAGPGDDDKGEPGWM